MSRLPPPPTVPPTVLARTANFAVLAGAAVTVQPVFSGLQPPCKTNTDKSFSRRPTKESAFG